MAEREEKREETKSDGSRWKVVGTGASIVERLLVSTAPLSALVFIATAAALTYSAVLGGPFVYDDIFYIVNNRAVAEPSLLDPVGTRYVGFLSFALNYAAGGLDTTGYHLFNIIVHAAAGVLVWSLVVLILSTPAFMPAFMVERKEGGAEKKYFIALAAALVFIVHPVQTQAVAYITQRFASLATLFYLLTVVLYLKARLGTGSRAALFYLLSIAAALLAVKTKEITFTLPFVIMLFELVLFRGGGFKGIDEGRGRVKATVLRLLPFFLVASLIPLSYLIGAGAGAGEDALVDEALRSFQVRDVTYLSPLNYLITEFRVIVTYMRLLVFPSDLHIIYDYPVYESFFELPVLLSFLFIFTVLSSSLYVLWRGRWRRARPSALLGALGVVWFFVTLSVESSVIPIQDVIAEHRLYLPSVGATLAFSAVLAAVFFRPASNGRRSGAALLALLVVTVSLGVVSYKRAAVWADPLRLWSKEVALSPERADLRNTLGAVLWKSGDYDEAIVHYRVALGIRPGYFKARNNLGVALVGKGDYDGAIEEYRRALLIEPVSASVYYNLGVAYEALGDTEVAVSHYKRASALDGAHAKARYSLGVIYGEAGRYDEAAREFLAALELKEGYAAARYGLAMAYWQKGMEAEAVREFERTLETDSGHVEARRRLTEIANVLKGRR